MAIQVAENYGILLSRLLEFTYHKIFRQRFSYVYIGYLEEKFNLVNYLHLHNYYKILNCTKSDNIW